MQFGYNNDYTEILEVEGSHGRRAVMFNNHEYDNIALMVLPSIGEKGEHRDPDGRTWASAVHFERRGRDGPCGNVVGGEHNRRLPSTSLLPA